MEEEKRIYRLNDDISFRKCFLSAGEKLNFGDCTDFSENEHDWRTYYSCNNKGIHFHCTKHPAIELNYYSDFRETYFECPRCKKKIESDSIFVLTNQCLRLLNMEKFKDAKLIRLDDWYVPEVKERIDAPSDYWIRTDVKTDRDGDTVVVLYIGHKGEKEKTQFFIKPEKLQLASDHKDLDPAKVLSKIEVTLRDRTLTQMFD